MLYDFITTNRAELIDRCRHKGSKRYAPSARAPTAECGVPIFLDQLVETLRIEQSTDVRGVLAPEQVRTQSDIGRSAALRGVALLNLGYTIDQVVHEYGNICQAVTELAIEGTAPISNDEFRTLNRCLDDAIAGAVSSYALAGKVLAADQAQNLHTRLEFFAEEHRRLVDVANLAFSAIKTGSVGVTGATGSLLGYALSELCSLVEKTVPEILSAIAATSRAPAGSGRNTRSLSRQRRPR